MDIIRQAVDTASWPDKLWDNHSVDPCTGCWEWMRYRNKKGYGNTWAEGRIWLSHRYAWHVTFGPIPEKLCVLHTCDNPACINPDHLFLGTNRDNLDDMLRKGRSRYGERHLDAKLTEAEVLEIRVDSRSCRKLSAIYGVAYGVIGQIKRREIWKHL